MGVKDRILGVAGDRQLPGERLEQADTQRVKICRGADTLGADDLLRSDVGTGPQNRPDLGQLGVGVHPARDPEVRDLRNSITSEENVSRLDVTMDNALGMDVLETVADGDVGPHDISQVFATVHIVT